MPQLKKRVEKKVCLITGASGRVGKSIALAMAAKGYAVCFTYIRSGREAAATLKELRVMSPESEMIKCDVASVKSLQEAFRFLRNKFGRLEMLITAASNFYPTPLPKVSEKDWDSLVDTNLKGTFFTMQFAALWMAEQAAKNPSELFRIITLSDVAAELVWRHHAPYTVSKLGIQHLTKIFAKEFAPAILVNSIAPGTVLLSPKSDMKHKADILKKIPLQRIGDPEDIVKAVEFLESSTYITGHILNVDGGRLLY